VKLKFIEKVFAGRALRGSKGFRMSYVPRRYDSSLVPYAPAIDGTFGIFGAFFGFCGNNFFLVWTYF